MLDVKTFALGEMGTNAYLITHPDSQDCLVVDCGQDPEELMEAILSGGWNPRLLLLTHGHFDHIAGVQIFREMFPDVKVGIHTLEASFLENPSQNLSTFWSHPVVCDPADFFLEEGVSVYLGELEFQVLHVPGHSPGSVVFYQKQYGDLFAGDVIFKGSIGRTDFPHSVPKDLVLNIKKKILPLPDDVIIYSGHGPSTTLGQERRENPYIQGI